MIGSRLKINNPIDTDFYVDYQLKNNDQEVDENLRKLQERYGKEYL